MKKIIILVVISIGITNFCRAYSLNTNSWNDFEGKIGKSDIQLSIYLFENGDIKGNYCYKKYGDKIPFTGQLNGNKVKLTEFINGKENGFFSGNLFTDNLDRFAGTWTDKTKSQKIKFKLTVSSICTGCSYTFRYSQAFYGTTDKIESFMKRVKISILNNDIKWLAGHICYPVKVSLNKTKTVKINNNQEFLKNYDKIIHRDFKKKISEFYTVNLFCNWRGAMLGNGEIWINNKPSSDENNNEYCITAINN